MASRGPFGFRSAKQSERADPKETTSVGPSLRPPIMPSAPNTSKMPTQSSSFFSRSKHGRAKVDPYLSTVAASSKTSINKPSTSNSRATPQSEPDARTTVRPPRKEGLVISTGSQITAIPVSRLGKESRNVSRRKIPINQHGRYARTESSASSHEPASPGNPLETESSPGGYTDPFPASVLGIAVPTVSSGPVPYLASGPGLSFEMATSSSRMASYNIRKSSQTVSTQNLPPPTPTFAHDSGSSTRRSESPGAFSRTSTPTSMSSQSPGISTPINPPARTKPLSPTRSRPPVTRRKLPGIAHPEDNNGSHNRGLTAVRESATSSSSSSTVKGTERRDASQVRSTSARSTPIPASPPIRSASKRLAPSLGDELGRRQDVLQEVPEQRLRDAPGPQWIQGDFYGARSNVSQPYSSKTPPPRPSREGTPKLDDTLEPMQGIHTYIDLPVLQTAGHRRLQSHDRELTSTESKTPYTGRTTLGRFPSNASSVSVRPSRMPSPNTIVTKPSRPTPLEPFQSQAAAQAATPLEVNTNNVRAAKDPSPLSASSSKSSRFGFFTKRTRSPLESTAYDNTEKHAKKGPAAGTGHEGYGKYARRGRSGSASTSASRGRSTSTSGVARTPTSRKSSSNSRDEPEMDDFLRERPAPVAMTGVGRPVDGPSLVSGHYPMGSQESSTAMQSNQSLDARNFSHQNATIMPNESLITEATSTHHLRRDHRRLPHRTNTADHLSEQQERRGIDVSRREPTLAARRSAHRSQLFGQEARPVKIPAPIDTKALAASPTIHSRDTVPSSVIRTHGTRQTSDDISEGREGNWLRSQRPEKRGESKSPRKWNFFQRVQATPRKPVESIAPRPINDQGSINGLPATVSNLPTSRSVPFYALLDGSEQEELDQIGVLLEQQHTEIGRGYGPTTEVPGAQEVDVRRNHKLSMLLPSPPQLSAEFSSLRGPLSPSVILHPPGITAANPAETANSIITQPKKPRLQQVGRIPRVISKRDRPHKPPPQSFSRPFARRPAEMNEPTAAIVEQGDNVTVERPLLGGQTEVIPSDHWGPQDSAEPASAPNGTWKDEFLAFPPRIGSEVSGSSSSGILSFAATTAVVPEPGTAPDEDEVWNEYNEFLDTVESPARPAGESENSHETIFQKKGWAPAPLHIQKGSWITGSSSSTERKLSATNRGETAPKKPLPDPPDSSKLDPSGLPTSSGTISDLLVGYGDRNRSSGVSKRQSSSSGSRYSISSIESAPGSLAGRESKGGERVTPLMAAKTSAGPIVQNTLRFDALMTSRWLSFDRVLFSPALAEANSNRKDRILVLDGLGNDDWSFYCAETYADADIFNLSPTAAKAHQSAALQPPKNYHQIQHANLGDRFPFEPDFFTAVVLRFPAATSEEAYLNAVSECMRVLRIGGYLEMSILDIDMVNMGNRARRALRELKYRMGVSSPEVSVKPLSDNLQMMVKRSGFKNLSRCMVNVPVVGQLSRSRSESLDGNSGSLGDLRIESSGKRDGGLAKSLSMVGRWWFTRCYEMISLPYGDEERSIWSDKLLLEECEKKETGFKLLLCYAQKPAYSDSKPGFQD